MDEMERTEKQELEERDGAERTRTSRVYMPRVDIYEQDDETVLVADMPGVDEKSVDITLEKNVLTIKAATSKSPCSRAMGWPTANMVLATMSGLSPFPTRLTATRSRRR
jgi:HSP20 family molecular chaperone IbpA